MSGPMKSQMQKSTDAGRRPRTQASRARMAGRWLLLIAVSILLALGLQAAGLPAALLLGPMVAAVALGVGFDFASTLRVPHLPYWGAQSVVGCLIASAITPEIVTSFLVDWPLFVGIVISTLIASSVLGWLMSRWRVLPGTTGVWGSSPGAATAMVVMAEAFGADVRLVAFMQYLRVVCVALAASLIARFLVPVDVDLGAMDNGAAAQTGIVWFPEIDATALATTLALAVIGGIVGRKSRIPAGTLLVPMLVGAVLHSSGVIRLQLPEWLLAPSYALLGWNIGLGFTRPVLAHATRALPQILLSIALLMGFCGGLAFLLTRFTGIDPLSAYLATSPGGMDSIAIIAASTKVDLSFVMALQTVRFSLVVVLGPAIARFIAHRAVRSQHPVS